MHVHLLILVAALTVSSFTAIAADAPSATSQWMAEDIAVFRDRFVAVDKSFTRVSRANAEARLEELRRRIGTVDTTEFVVELCRIAVLADNGHTRCMSKSAGEEFCRQWALIEGRAPRDCEAKAPDVRVPDFETVALGFRPFRSEFYVVNVAKENADLLGARLLAVNGKRVDEGLREVLRSFSGGTIGYRDLRSTSVLTSPERLHAVGINDQARSVTYELFTTAGRNVERTFELGAKPASMAQRPANAPPLPWALQEPNVPFRFKDAPELNAVIIQLRQNVDSPTEKIDAFLRESEANRARLGRKDVVLDMRVNGGGNLVATRDFIVTWPSLVPGRFFVLTSPQTFSAGMVSIAYLEQAAPTRVIIVGEPVGDRLMYFSDGRPVRLPHSGLMLYTSLVRMDLHDGCRKYDDCHASISQPGRPTAPLPAGAASITRMPIAVKSLAPDVLAPWTIESWLNGTDPMLEAVDAFIDRQK